jgi:heme/copper-type cytochrome/quinol oxidase subunit 4
MATLVYLLCALTSLACAVLLLRGYARSRVRLLLWAGLCFVGLALNNIILFVDVRVVPDVDLSTVRSLPALAGLVILIYGLVWETR